MKHMQYTKIIGLISALFFLISCGGGGGGGAASVGFSTIKITIGGVGPTAKIEIKEDTLFANVMDLITPAEAIAQTCYFPQDVKRIFFSIEGNDMTRITRNVTVDNCPIVREFQVPNGSSRVFNAYAYNAADKQAYAGSTLSAVPAPGNLVQIIMKPIVFECDLYVDINNNVGDLSNDCTDPSEPCETITHALDPAQTPLGDETICVLPGVYRPAYEDPGESYPLIVDRSITLLCLNLIPGNGDVAANADNGVFLPAFPECILEGMRWDESYEPDGVVIKDNATINNFRIQHFPYPSGSQVFTGVNVVSGEPFVINNRITENVTGIGISGGNPHVRNNFISGNDQGIVIFPGIGADHDITNNTIGCNNLYDLFSNQTSGIINVPNNMWDHAPPEEFDRRDTTGCPAISDDICYDSNLGDVTVNTSPSIHSDFICNIFGPL